MKSILITSIVVSFLLNLTVVLAIEEDPDLCNISPEEYAVAKVHVLERHAKESRLCKFSEEELNIAREAAKDRQNVLRCMHQARPIVLDEQGNLYAQDYSIKLVTKQVEGHSKSCSYWSENLWGGGAGEPLNLTQDLVAAVNDWYSEIEYYADWPNTEPEWMTVGHFRNEVDKHTIKVGLGIAYGKEDDKCAVTSATGVYWQKGSLSELPEFMPVVDIRPSRTEEYCTKAINAYNKRGNAGRTYSIQINS